MGFWISRFWIGLKRDWRWGVALTLVATLVYLLVAALLTPRWTLTQPLTVGASAVVAASGSPVDTLAARALLEQPDELFQDPYALNRLWRLMAPTETGRELGSETELARLVHARMHLRTGAAEHWWLVYEGPNPALGMQLVDFYVTRLLERARQGAQRVASRQEGAGAETSSILIGGELRSETVAVWWRTERLLPALGVFGLSLLLVAVFIVLREWLDPSFKSERQVARYLGLPILGSMPEAIPLLRPLADAADMAPRDSR